MSAAEEQRRALAWEVELDRLELDVIRAERLLGATQSFDQEDWSVPQLAGTMPLHLFPRAQELHERQAAVLVSMARALQRCNRQRSFASQVAQVTSTTSTPAYVDLTT